MDKRIEVLEKKALALRKDIVDMIFHAKSGHPGGSLSEIDILTVLFHQEMNFSKDNMYAPDRDRFVLSKGHTAPGLYVNLADLGCFPRERLFDSYRVVDGILQGHPSMKTPGVEIAGGSLGVGLSVANGMALGLRLQNLPSRVYCMLGDGEINEGQVWEAAATARSYRLSNVCAIVDVNHLQNDDATERIKDMGDLSRKWSAFGWNVIEIDGHDMAAILWAFASARECRDLPSVILAETVKGKGVSYMENRVEWHGKVPNEGEYAQAVKELGI